MRRGIATLVIRFSQFGILLCLAALLFVIGDRHLPHVHATSCPTGYAHSAVLHIPPQSVWGGQTLTDFTFTFVGSSTFKQSGSGGDSLTTGGLDIVFCDAASSGNLLNWKLKNYDGTTGLGDWKIKDTLSPTADNPIYMFWGKSSDSDHSNAAAAWDSNFIYVATFGTSGSLSITDDISGGTCTPTNTGTVTATSGVILGGASFNGSSKYYDTGCNYALASGSTPWTIEFFGNSTTWATSAGVLWNNLASNQLSGFGAGFQTGGPEAVNSGTSGLNVCAATTGNASSQPGLANTTDWTYVAASFNGGNATLATSYETYVDARRLQCRMTQTGGTPAAVATVHAIVGRWINASFPNWVTGNIDEIRVSKVDRSEGWKQTSWFSTKYPTQFYYLGSVPFASKSVDQFPRPLLAANPLAVVSGAPVFLFGRTTGTCATPTDNLSPATTYTLVDSTTAGGTLFPYVWKGTPSVSGTATITSTGCTAVFGVQFPAAVGSTVDQHNNGVFATTGMFIPTALTNTANGDLHICYVTGNGGVGGYQNPFPYTDYPEFNSIVSFTGTNAALGISYQYDGPSTAGAYTCAFQNYGNTAGAWVSFSIKQSAIAMVTTSLPTAVQNKLYFYTLQSWGGAGAPSYTVTSGSLPAGINLDASSGVLYGTPTAGSSTFTVQVSDGTHTATQSLTLTVNSGAGTPSVAHFIAQTNSNRGTLSSVTAGNLICGVIAVGNVGLTPPGSSLSVPYIFIDARRNNVGINNGTQLWCGVTPSSGNETLTAGAGVQFAVELANVQQFYDLLAGFNDWGTQTNGTRWTPQPVLTPTDNSLIWAWTNASTDTTTWTAGTGFTTDTGVTTATTIYEAQAIHELAATAGGYAPSFVQSGTTAAQEYWSLVFRPSTSGAVGSGKIHHQVISQ